MAIDQIKTSRDDAHSSMEANRKKAMPMETEMVAIMENELYRAAIKGDVSFLEEARVREMEKGNNNEYFLRLTYENSNVLHIAARGEKLDFIKAVLGSFFPELVMVILCGQNSKGDTPLHIAAKVGHIGIVELLVESYCKEFEGEVFNEPWRVQNSEGNTPLHVALVHGKVEVATYLLEVYPKLARFVNRSKETPLHLAVQYYVQAGDKSLTGDTMRLLFKQQIGHLGSEDSLSIIQLLLKKDNSPACWCDINGLTPLFRATSCPESIRLCIIRAILESSPLSAEVRDPYGKTVLHVLEEISCYKDKDFLMIPEIYDLRNEQDIEGNTPAHVAVKNRDANMVKILLESSANFTIKNKQGVSAAMLLQQDIDLQNMIQSKLDQDSINDDDWITMPSKVYEAIKGADFRVLRQIEKEWLRYREPSKDRGHIIHALIKEHKDFSIVNDFINEILQQLPILILQMDRNGDTPLHTYMKQEHYDPNSLSFINMCNRYFQEAKEKGTYCSCPPWKMKNLNGNTPLHEALQLSALHIPRIKLLLEFDNEVATVVNNREETPLHVLCRNIRFELNNDTKALVHDLHEANSSAISKQDADGHNPIIVADKYGNLQLVKLLCKLYQSVGGRSILEHCDDDENTELHLAIEKGNFGLAQVIVEVYPYFLQRKNKKGVTPAELIGSEQYVPPEFERVIWSKMIGMYCMIGNRSFFGIPTTVMQEYTNTIGLIAALLATIAFTAAFTVPGGFNSDNGTPILLKKVAFQVFMASDILSMCFSTMVLFCLLWVMSTSDKRQSVMLLDFMIFLLQASFYMTLLTFMTGIYVSTFPIMKWLSILVCIFCCAIFLLMSKRYILALVGIVFRVYFFLKLVWYMVTESMRWLKHWIAVVCAKLCGYQESESDEETPMFFREFWELFFFFLCPSCF